MFQGMKEVCAALGGVDRSTVLRWENKFGLPLTRPAGRAVMLEKKALLAWLAGGRAPRKGANKARRRLGKGGERGMS